MSGITYTPTPQVQKEYPHLIAKNVKLNVIDLTCNITGLPCSRVSGAFTGSTEVHVLMPIDPNMPGCRPCETFKENLAKA